MKTKSKPCQSGRVIGVSQDNRTNKWWLICPRCGDGFEPPTTMFARVGYVCQKCGKPMSVDYNKLAMSTPPHTPQGGDTQ